MDNNVRMAATDLGNSAIWPPYEVFYIYAMQFNARSALASIKQVNRSIENLNRDVPGDHIEHLDIDGLLDNVQNIVVQGAALSRYFWPVRRGHEARAKLLKQALGVTEDSPLANRDLRNQIEHFDERLDDYLSGGVAGHILPKYVGPLPEPGDITVHIFRGYYIDVGVFEMLGRRYEIPPIASEVSRLHDRLLSCEQNGGRLLPPTWPAR